jgi:glutamyl-tRNA synthetase
MWPIFEKLLPALKERAKTLVELLESTDFLFAPRPLTFDEKATGMLSPEARSLMGELRASLEQLSTFSAASVEADVRAFAERKGVKLGQVAQPLRAALTGRAVSPPIFDVLEALGRDESLARLADIEV